AELDDLEILLVDDGSSDDTLTKMRALAAADPRVRYLSFSRNFGLAAAVTAGFRYAGKPWIAQVDSDLQNPPVEIWKLLAKAAEGYDAVFGIREHRQDPVLRRWGSTVQQWLARRVFGIEVPSGASSFRVLRAGVARTLAELRLGGPYFIAMVPMVGARYACVPTAHRRRQGRSRFRVTKLVSHTFELFFGYSWRPLNAVYLVAAAGAVTAVLAAILGAVGWLSPLGGTEAALLVSAGTLTSVALVGRYLQRLMLDQKPTRPYYVREANLPIRDEDRLDSGYPPAPVPTRASAHRLTTPVDSPPLLVLGAGEEQLPLYLEARRRGLRTIAADQRTDRPGLHYADEFLQLSTRDAEPIADALGGRSLAGVVTTGSDAGLSSWAELSERYQLAYRFPRTAARASVDKGAFHAISAAAGVPAYRWRQHHDPEVLAELADEVGYPLIVKPADGSGSKGVTRVSGPEHLAEALAYAARCSLRGEVLLEEYLDGRNLTVNVFMRDGACAFTAITEKRILPGPNFVIGGHSCPAPISADLHDELAEVGARLCRAVGLTDGPANLDVIVDNAGRVHVLEANLRLAGNSVPRLIRQVYGVDSTAALVSLATGQPFDLAGAPVGTGIVHMLGSPLAVDGVLREVRGLDAVRAMPAVTDCQLYLEPGAVVHPFTEGAHKLGHLLVSGPDLETAEATLAEALTKLRVIVVPAGTPMAAPVPRPGRPILEGATHAAP
ncbi:MAG TPA: glycosyltransferase, partial [Micromonosporaceae bacterium]